MAIDTRIPMMGQGIDTANPLAQLASGMARKQENDGLIARQQEQQSYERQTQQEQEAYNRERQSKIDGANMSSKSLDDQLTRERIINEQFKGLNEREQARIGSVAIAAAQVKPFLDAGDTEGALNMAQKRLGNLHSRMGSGEAIDDTDTREFIKMLESGDVQSAKQHVDAMVQVGQMTGVLKTPKSQNGGMTIDPQTGEMTYTAPPKAMPASALKMQNEALDVYSIAGNTQADLGSIVNQIDTGALDLGVLSNMSSSVMNKMGSSDENSRNFATFRASLEKLRNDSLRLNKGVQTDGDAQRAWSEFFPTDKDGKVTDFNMPTDGALVKQRLQQIQAINQRAAELKQLEVDNIRANYGQPNLDYSKYQKGSALDVGQPQQSQQGQKIRVANPQTGEQFDIDPANIQEALSEGFQQVK